MNASTQVVVRVDEEDVSVWVAKSGKVTWRAWATFRGRHINVSGQSKTGAVDAWKQTADYASKE
ncbi:hypothetical protein PQR75_40820 [Paraburkholderia fungorum]|uniref:hypothetical protein n=1 Tax=Paraburkholderia fungorum TaxID=134537 RepID=UPI0038B9C470